MIVGNLGGYSNITFLRPDFSIKYEKNRNFVSDLFRIINNHCHWQVIWSESLDSVVNWFSEELTDVLHLVYMIWEWKNCLLKFLYETEIMCIL